MKSLTLTDRLGLHQYGYDALSQLTRADHPLDSGLVDEAFTYDPVGNRLTSHLSATHRHDAANRLLEDDTFTEFRCHNTISRCPATEFRCHNTISRCPAR